VNYIRLILASESARRRDLLIGVGIIPTIVPSNVKEDLDEEVPSPESLVKRLAEKKVRAVLSRYPDNYILGADTLVYLGEEVLGKPQSELEAEEMLRRLSGKVHSVYTGVALYDPEARIMRTAYDCTAVKMRTLDEEDITWYVETGEPVDKAGAYALQGAGAFLIEKIEGDYTGVIGLPLPKVLGLFTEAGVSIRDLIEA
jgi:septum formation protein